MFEPIKLSDSIEDGIRKASFKTSDAVCSLQIDIELEGETIRSLQYTKGCHGNTQAIISESSARAYFAQAGGLWCGHVPRRFSARDYVFKLQGTKARG